MNFQNTLGTTYQNIKSQFQNVSSEMQACIENCTSCAQICEQLLQHCLEKGGIHAEAKHIKTLQDCSEICQLSARFMLRDSQLHHLTCELCAEACLACAQDCDRFSDDEFMMASVNLCRMCAESCERMARAN